MDNLTLTIDNIKVKAPKKSTILEAAKLIGINIPTLCYLKGVNEIASCRVCLVEVEGLKGLQPACKCTITEGMVIKTSTQRVREARKSTVELILSDHNRECLTCFRNGSCELQTVSQELGISKINFEGEKREGYIDNSSPSIVRDKSKCILCGRCVSICKNIQKIGVLEFANNGFNSEVRPVYNKNIAEVPCVYCGQCIVSCPVAALKEKNDIDRVWDALENPDIHVIVQTAPAVRSALGEEFGLPIGTRVTGKMVSSLKRLGFDKVYDTNFGADLTIMEEGHELLNRLDNPSKLPMITSCSPGWIRFCEFYYPEFIPNLSTCKSPHQMLGAITKSYYAQKQNIDPNKIFTISIMPCTCKKSEIVRPGMEVDGLKDVDAVITTRELAKMIKQARIDFIALEDDTFDYDLFGEYTGAGAIFGTTGGVMEATLRTVADLLESKDLESFEYKQVRGLDGIKEAELNLGGKTIRVAVAHGTGMAAKLLDMIKNKKAHYDFIEIMGCSGGCVTGGGQPHVSAKVKMDFDIRKERANALYEEDTTREFRKSYKNPLIKKLYKEFLGEPNSEKAHKLLHTHEFEAKEKYPFLS